MNELTTYQIDGMRADIARIHAGASVEEIRKARRLTPATKCEQSRILCAEMASAIEGQSAAWNRISASATWPEARESAAKNAETLQGIAIGLRSEYSV